MPGDAISTTAGVEAAYSVAPSTDYLPPLDGLRAASILLVMGGHLGLSVLFPGLFGVTIFFFISGFLITRQLLAELERKGTLSLSSFYVRRVLRLYPALLVMIVVAGSIFTLCGGPMTCGDMLAALLYGANYYGMLGGFDWMPGVVHPFDIQWSLAVEEHYYLVFPLLALLLGRNRLRFALVILVVCLLVAAWRSHLYAWCSTAGHACMGDARYRVERGTDTRVDSILYGALLATLLGSTAAPAVLRMIRSPVALAAGGLMLLASLLIRDPAFRQTTRYSMQGAGLFCCVGWVLFAAWGAPLRRVLSLHPMLLIGRWSYSLYLWHWVVLMLAGLILPATYLAPILHETTPSLLQLLTVVPGLVIVSFIFAATSYHLVERPMLALRRRFGSHVARPESTATEP